MLEMRSSPLVSDGVAVLSVVEDGRQRPVAGRGDHGFADDGCVHGSAVEYKGGTAGGGASADEWQGLMTCTGTRDAFGALATREGVVTGPLSGPRSAPGALSWG